MSNEDEYCEGCDHERKYHSVAGCSMCENGECPAFEGEE